MDKIISKALILLNIHNAMTVIFCSEKFQSKEEMYEINVLDTIEF
jgi:hypothetical protein